ncbi:RNA polymerase recycling motor HelD [Companilactobacillus nantensis]|uniref:DNA helicase n=1 Tax=Companilactobacillus nantensis DSM 16982 TaxID=1423774 RepID=A0A0R1WD41_9LACO|nr:RNA polymerase recycling motor HelD [Companilactobacillus nantensis]KRM15679.1 DNA helicase [Companilactobacillus nantensis DSM 16982]GEO64636.1 DNA helicase [Companilactobacillus nantensis]
MSINQSKQEEQERVNVVADKIDKKIERVDQSIAQAHQETHRIERNYGENTKVNTTEVDDQMETNASVQQQKQLVALAVENENILNSNKLKLENLQGSPYFGRIDIVEDGEEDTLYIGTSTLQDEDGEFLIYDWRAPISGIYYNGVLGKVHYQTPNGPTTVDLKKKRQFQIVHNQIRTMFDTNETVGDEILQSVLSEYSDEYLRNIVSTIQREQNTIIRDTHSDVLLVQGVAGSGKTSAILQRVAYLLYHSRSTMNADNIVLFSPNKLFSNYISEVLPSLGERNMRQVTLNEFISLRLSGVQVETLFERYEKDEHNLPETTIKIRLYKESGEFLDHLAELEETHPDHILHFEDVIFDGKPFFTKEEISKIYDHINHAYHIPDRFLKTKNILIKRLQKRIHADRNEDWVQAEIDNLSDEDFQQIITDHNIEESASQREIIAEEFLRDRYAPIYNALINNYFFNPYKEYLFLLGEMDQDLVPDNVWQTMIESIDDSIETHKLNLSDSVAILYLRDLLTDGGINHAIQHIFIDEVQDYTMAQLKYIAHAFPNAKMTLLGDRAQDVLTSSYRKKDLVTEVNDLFNKKKITTITLNQSYRSTAEITNFATKLLPNGSEIKAFSRQGEDPVIKVFDNDDYYQGLKDTARELNKKYDTVAILTRNQAQAEQIYAHYGDESIVTLVDADFRSIPKGILVLPIYLAKGLEFDAVIAHDVSATNYPDERSVDVLYTICTRAMHSLTLCVDKEVSPLLSHESVDLISEQ